jgi:hypothetical protein
LKLENERLHVGNANSEGEKTAHCESIYAEKALRIDQVEEKDESLLRPFDSSDIKSGGPKQETSKVVAERHHTHYNFVFSIIVIIV